MIPSVETPASVDEPDLAMEEAVHVDLSDAFEPETPPDDGPSERAFLEMFGSMLVAVGDGGEVAGANPPGSTTTKPIVRESPIAWDGADPWKSLGLAPPRHEDSARLLGLIVKTLVQRGFLDVREVADVLVPPIDPA